MSQPFYIINEEKIPDTHFFIYKGNKFPFNFDYFKYSSQFFFKNQSEFQESTTINLLDEQYDDSIDLSNKTIVDFIKFCQNQRIEINHQNAIGLNYLAKIYEVSSLTKNSENYITAHSNDLIIEKLRFFGDKKNEMLNEKYEDIIAEKFSDFINDDRLLSLSFSVIYRILIKYLNNFCDCLINMEEKLQFYFPILILEMKKQNT